VSGEEDALHVYTLRFHLWKFLLEFRAGFFATCGSLRYCSWH